MVSDSRSTRDEAGREHAPNGMPHASPLEPLLRHLAELREIVMHYVTVRQDKLKATARRILVMTLLGVLAAFIAVTMLIVAVALLVVGLAEGLGQVLGDYSAWGKILVGGGICLAAVTAVLIAARLWTASSRRKTIEKYEHRHAKQRATFSQDVIQRAARRHDPV